MYAISFRLAALWRRSRAATAGRVTTQKRVYNPRVHRSTRVGAGGRELACDLDDSWHERRYHPLSRLQPRLRRVTDDPGRRDVAQHVHWDDNTGPFVSHAVLPERRPRQTGGADSPAAVVRVAR